MKKKSFWEFFFFETDVNLKFMHLMVGFLREKKSRSFALEASVWKLQCGRTFIIELKLHRF